MEYINAFDILPKELVIQIQQYVGGNILYIPKEKLHKNQRKTSRKHREELIKRNQEIRMKKKNGASIEKLMEEYYLSSDSIKSIVYRKK